MCVIVVEGIIGAGKSTLMRDLSKSLNLRPIHEPVESNPYLSLFYKDQHRWGFPMQIELLHRRFAMQKLAAWESISQDTDFRGAILDRSMSGDRCFASLLTKSGAISELEFSTYEKCHDVMACSLQPPALMIFLDVSPEKALERIKTRARGAETGISLEYLNKLRDEYENLIKLIHSGKHQWSRGLSVMRLNWETDHLPVEPIISEIKQNFGL
jgi:deoxyadenosine/deoxycytidine kinase